MVTISHRFSRAVLRVGRRGRAVGGDGARAGPQRRGARLYQAKKAEINCLCGMSMEQCFSDLSMYSGKLEKKVSLVVSIAY